MGYERLKNAVFSVIVMVLSLIVLERTAKESDSLVSEKLHNVRASKPEYRRAREILRESVQTIG